MLLYILTNPDGTPIADKQAALVTSVSDSTPVADAGNLILGDSEPVTIKFTTGTAAPAFAGDATYALGVALGLLSNNGVTNFSSNTAFAAITGGWSGRLAMDTQDLAGNVSTFSRRGGSQALGTIMYLQVRVITPSGYAQTYALVPVFVELKIFKNPPTDSTQTFLTLAQILQSVVRPMMSITSLTGGGVTALNGQVTAPPTAGADYALPTGATYLLSDGRVGRTWQLILGTDADAPTAGVVRPADYNASTNARIWVQL